MPQHDMVIDNGPGLAVRTDINAALMALVQLSAGPVEPATKYPDMFWLDTTLGYIRQRNHSNTAWITPAVNCLPLSGGTVSGSIVAGGSITAGAWVNSDAGGFVGSLAQAVLGTATGASGTVYLRPNGYGSGTNQTKIESNGLMTVGGALTASSVNATTLNSGTFSTTGATAGTQASSGRTNSSVTASTGVVHYAFYNTAGAGSFVGSIATTGTATAYGTSSDENLKELEDEYDPAEAIAIIRADPVLGFTWKSTGEKAVGWFAQKSHAVDPNLAIAPPEPTEGEGKPAYGEEGYEPWGSDYGRRTPHLWAALTWALDKIDALEARLAALEAAP